MLIGDIKNETRCRQKRADFKKALVSGKLLRAPGAFSPFVARIIEKSGFDAVYISGAGIANDLGLPDIGLTTQTEVVGRGKAIASATRLPCFIDIDTGFGEVLNVARTVQELEDARIVGCHLEDQTNPKRCGHLDNKSLVDLKSMCLKIQAAALAKRDENFIVMARTDARASEGLESAIDRAKAYVDSGADAIFPEAMVDEKDFEAFRKAIKVPILANMTEFGKSKLLNAKTLESLGVNIVIYPMTGFRLAMKAIEEGFQKIKSDGDQAALIDKMQTRARLYEILDYENYNQLDQSVFNFKLK